MATAWDDEYRRKGIPSSYRDAPSGSVTWALDRCQAARAGRLPATALDIGCGTGRNAVALARVLAPDGCVLVALAHPDDGYYGSCPPASTPAPGSPRVVVDPVAGVPSVLFTLDELEAEMADRFELAAAIDKRKPGPMHGRTYVRRTLATLWRRRAGR